MLPKNLICILRRHIKRRKYQPESGNYIRFQPDAGAQCNVLPLHIYKRASNDHNLEKVKSVQTSLLTYGG